MADSQPSGRRKIPPPKKTYTPPHEEERSEATQAAADQFLDGKPTIRHGEAK